jgi:sn-glycerol 3-phosphate transport system ATP-binding protein
VVTCELGSQLFTARIAGKASLQPGAAVHVGWPPEKVHVFDAASGRRRDDASAMTAQNNNVFELA